MRDRAPSGASRFDDFAGSCVALTATRSGGLEYRATTAQWHADRSARRLKPSKLTRGVLSAVHRNADRPPHRSATVNFDLIEKCTPHRLTFLRWACPPNSIAVTPPAVPAAMVVPEAAAVPATSWPLNLFGSPRRSLICSRPRTLQLCCPRFRLAGQPRTRCRFRRGIPCDAEIHFAVRSGGSVDGGAQGSCFSLLMQPII